MLEFGHCLLEVSLLLLLTAKKSSFPRGVIKLLAVLPRLTGTIELQTTASTPTAASHSEASIKWIANLSKGTGMVKKQLYICQIWGIYNIYYNHLKL